MQSWDTASKMSELSDYSVCTTWGQKDKKVYLLHVFRKRLDYPDLKRAVVAQRDRFHPHRVLIEDQVSGTLAFRQLYVLVILRHGRRIIVHATAHPTAEWVKQQLREAFPFDDMPRYLIFDNDTTFGAVKSFVASMGIQAKRTAFHCPWQNGAVERFNGTLRRELLDHVIVLNEAHLRRLLKDFIDYYHDDRTHLALGKDAPRGRPEDIPPNTGAAVDALPRIGGLHHRYVWRDAA